MPSAHNPAQGFAGGNISLTLHLSVDARKASQEMSYSLDRVAGTAVLTLIGLDCALLPEEGKCVLLLLMCHGRLREKEKYMHSTEGFTALVPFRLLCTDTS